MYPIGKQKCLLIVVLAVSVLGMLSLTIAFCFWSIYILEALQRKWRYYKNEMRCMQLGDSSSQQQISVYNTKTDCIKLLFLFFINLLEWMGVVSLCIAILLNITQKDNQNGAEENHSNNITVDPYYALFFIGQGEMQLNSALDHSIHYLANNLLVMSLILIASLCMYLSARYAQLSWIKSTKIPYLIGFFLLCVIATQTLTSICSISIIGYWLSMLLVTVSLLIALKQYRKLQMIIGWTIVDLSISGNKRLLDKQIKMKKGFTKLSTLMWIVFCLLIVSGYVCTMLTTLVILLREKDNSGSYISLCENSHFSNPEVYRILSIFSWVNLALGFIAVPIIGIPYIVYGFSTMYLILWRLYKGKSEYKTHFPNHLTTQLIKVNDVKNWE